MTKFNYEKINENFSRSSKNYDAEAEIQKIAAKKLCDLILPLIQENSKILDLGSGTSFIAQNLHKKALEKNTKIYEVDLSQEMLDHWSPKPSNVFAIRGDIQNLQFEENSFDIIISSFCLQWLEDFDRNFLQFFKILKPNGIFAFCLPTSESLKELRLASIESGCDFNFNDLPKIENLKFFLKKSGFIEKKIFQEIIIKEFTNGYKALKSLKILGANHSNKIKKLINKTKLQKFNNFCLKNFAIKNKNIKVSWMTSYFILTKTP